MSRPADILLRQGDTTPQWPTAGQISFYSKSNGVFYSLDSNGVETPFGAGTGGGTVTSVSVIANPSRLTATGNPITTSGSITLDLAETTVVAGAYTNANITVDAYGRITAASNGSAVAGVSSFNTRTGDIILDSSDVTTALGFTPYNATNPAGYITGITSGNVTTALGYTPYSTANPAGYISGITGSNVTTALGYTPYDATNPAGYISGITSGDVTSALGFTPGVGTVTSVGSTGNNGVTVSGAPITGSGTITIGLADITPLSVSATGSVTGINLSGTNTGDQTITLTGDVTGSGTGSFATALSTTGVVANTYGDSTTIPQFTVDAKGRITNVTNVPISESGLGTVTSVSGTGTVSGLTLTGTVTSTGNLTLGGALTLTSGQVTTALGFTPYNSTNPNGYTNNTGTVTSVSVSGGSTGLSFSGNPITTSGTATMAGTLLIANGGTGQTTAAAAANALLPSQTGNSGKFLTTDGSSLSWGTAAAGSGTVTSVSGTGTVSGLTLTGTVTSTGNLTLGGTLSLTSGQVTTALGFTPYNATNPSGYTSNTGTVTSVSATGSSDITVSGSPITTTGTLAFALADTAVTPGAYTNANVTVDAKGRITLISNGTAGSGTVTSVGLSSSGTIIVGSSPVTTSGTITVDLATTSVVANTYGSATQVPVLTVDAYGRITGVTNTTITGSTPAGLTETVIFRYDTGSGGAMTGVDAIQSQTSGVTATVTSGAACTCTFTFTGKSTPPKTVTTYAQNTSNNNFVTKDVSAYLSNTTSGGGTVAAPAILTGYTSANVLTLTLTQGATGAVGGIGLRAFLMVTFGF